MSDPVKEAVERLYHSAKLCTQYDLSHFTVRGSDLTAILAELSRLSRLVEEAGEALGVAEAQIATLYTSISRGDAEAGARFATGDPAFQKIVAARASLTHKAISGGGG